MFKQSTSGKVRNAHTWHKCKKDQGRMWRGVLECCKLGGPLFATPCKRWDLKMISNIILACIVMHYKIIDDELNANLESLYERDAPNNLQRV